jgi:hypothetical protein
MISRNSRYRRAIAVAVPAALAMAVLAVAPSGAVVRSAGGGDDVVRGTSAADSLNGGGGSDIVNGLAGNDRIVGARGQDLLIGGRGNDRILARDGHADAISCGTGVDRVRADGKDTIAPGCERVTGAPQGELRLSVVSGNGQEAAPSRVNVTVAGEPAAPCVGPSGAVPDRTTTCSYRFVPGQPVTLTAAPDRSQSFQFWATTTDDCQADTDLSCTIRTTNPAVTVIAAFQFRP